MQAGVRVVANQTNFLVGAFESPADKKQVISEVAQTLGLKKM
jgi:hypothetical protein